MVLVVLSLEGRMKVDGSGASGLTVTGIRLGGVGDPRVRQLVETSHHLSKDVLRHLAWRLRRRQGCLMLKLMLRVGIRVGILHFSPNSLILWNYNSGQPLELFSDFLQSSVDMELRSLTEGLFAEGTLVILGTSSSSACFSIPVGGDAGLAEAVATWC